nr:hypothetical protein [Tanacetum cinerariifolium]
MRSMSLFMFVFLLTSGRSTCACSAAMRPTKKHPRVLFLSLQSAGRRHGGGPCRMQLLIAFDQPQVPVEPFELQAGRGQAVETHTAVHRTDRGVHALVTEHATEVDLVREVDQQPQLQNGQLPPRRVVVEFDADQRLDVGVIVQLAVFQALGQRAQADFTQAVQVQDVSAELQGLVGVVPDQVVNRIDFRVIRHQDAAGLGTDVLINRHVHFFAHAFEDTEQRGRFLGIGVFAVTGEVPLDEFEIRLCTEETPRHHTAG